MCIKSVNYWDKYTEMHVQQNVKKHIHSGCVILIDFPLPQCLHERNSMLRHTYIACLFFYFQCLMWRYFDSRQILSVGIRRWRYCLNGVFVVYRNKCRLNGSKSWNAVFPTSKIGLYFTWLLSENRSDYYRKLLYGKHTDVTRNIILIYEFKIINCFVDRVKNALLFMLVQRVIFKNKNAYFILR